MIHPRFSPSLDSRDFLAFLSGLFAGPEEVAEFEKAFAEAMGRKHAFAVPSGRAGLFFLLSTCGRKKGAAILPALTYYAVPAVAKLAGFPPLFRDLSPDTLLMDEEAVEKIPAQDASVLIPTHLYGRAQNMDVMMRVAKKKGWLVIEDTAQGLGASWRGKKCGSIGDAAFFTFGPTKNFTTLGGGMIALDDDAWAARIRERMGLVKRTGLYGSIMACAYAFAMRIAASPLFFASTLYPALRFLVPRGVDPIERATADPPHAYPLVPRAFFENNLRGSQARVGAAQLSKLEHLCLRRRMNGTRLAALLEDAGELGIPVVRDGEEPGYMSFPVIVDDPERFAASLIKMGVDTARGYMSCCPDLPIFSEHRADCPNAKRAVRGMVHLPVHPGLPTSAVDHVARAVRRGVQGTKAPFSSHTSKNRQKAGRPA